MKVTWVMELLGCGTGHGCEKKESKMMDQVSVDAFS